jgi:hypothetical protein
MQEKFLKAKEELEKATKKYRDVLMGILGNFTQEEIENARVNVDDPTHDEPYVVYCKTFKNFSSFIELQYNPIEDELELFVRASDEVLTDKDLFELVTEYNKISEKDTEYKSLYELLIMLTEE